MDIINNVEITGQKCWQFIKELNSAGTEQLMSTALSDGSRDYTYAQMFRRWEQYAKVFSALGITGNNRSRAAMTGIPCSETIFAYYGLNMTGVSVSMVFLSDLSVESEWEKIVRQESITDLILTDLKTSPELLHRIMRERKSLGIRNVIVMHVPVCGKLVSKAQKEYSKENYRRLKRFKGVLFMDELLNKYEDHVILPTDKTNDEAAVIVHTSGTTRGIHKPVPMSDEAINESAVRLLSEERFRELRGTAVGCLIVSLAIGTTFTNIMHLTFAYGGRLAAVPHADDPEDKLRALQYYRPNNIQVVPPLFEGLTRLPVTPDFSNLKFVFMGSGYVSAEAKERYDSFLKKCGSDAKVTVGYGLTEIGGACILSSPDKKEACIGWPLKGVRAVIRDELTGEYHKLEEGPRRGCLYLHSRSLSSGRIDGNVFFELEEIDGIKYLNTYDLVDVNADGSISYIGRTNKYFLNTEGVRFNAGIIETAMAKQPGIESCGLAPVFDKAHHDNIPVLYVQTLEHGAAGVRTLSRAMNNVFVRDNGISETSMPVQCVITDEIPYNESGKVDVFMITTNTIRGMTYNVRPVYRNGTLTEVKLVHADSSPGKKNSYIEAVINN